MWVPQNAWCLFHGKSHLEMDADRGTPTSESSISSIIPPPFFTCTPVLSQSYLVIIWLLYGYYLVIIWFLYGYYMVYDNNNLVGGAMCPSWKMELKSMGRMTSHIIIMEHKSHVWNHQPVLYEGGRVIYFPCWSNPIISDLQDLPTPLVAKWDDPPSNQLS